MTGKTAITQRRKSKPKTESDKEYLMWQQCQIQGVEVESYEDSDDDAD